MKIASLSQACKLLGYNPKTVLPNVSKMPKHLQKHTIAKSTLEIIAEASREGVELDYDNTDQYKWYPWFWLNKPGFRFYVSTCAFTDAYSTGGPRFCYLSREDSDWHAKKHLALYKTATVIPKAAKKKK